jgi:hypothetical protein
MSCATASGARDHVYRTRTWQTPHLNEELVFKLENLHRDCRFDQRTRYVVVDRYKG